MREGNTLSEGGEGRRRARRPLVIVAAVVILLTLMGGAAVQSIPHLLDRAPKAAPEFTIPVQDGSNFTLSAHRGEIVVIDLMAVDCPSCRLTEKALLDLRVLRPNVTLLSVDVWTTLEDPAYLAAHMQELGADWSFGMDRDDLLDKYDATIISKVVVVDPLGNIAWSHEGGVGIEALVEAVDRAAREEPGEDGIATAVLWGTLSASAGLRTFAALTGVAAFFAPCAFPLLPGYMAYTVAARRSAADDTRPPGVRSVRWSEGIAPGLAAAAGIFVVFALVGGFVAALGGTVARYVPLLQPLAGVAALLLGVLLVAGVPMTRIVRPFTRAVDLSVRGMRHLIGNPAAVDWRRSTSGHGTFFTYGVGYGAASAACTAPLFLQLALTAFAIGPLLGIQVFLAYALAASSLMVLATWLSLRAADRFRRYGVAVGRALLPMMGVILIGAGTYLVAYYWAAFIA